jgi:hypothetical protein
MIGWINQITHSKLRYKERSGKVMITRGLARQRQWQLFLIIPKMNPHIWSNEHCSFAGFRDDVPLESPTRQGCRSSSFSPSTSPQGQSQLVLLKSLPHHHLISWMISRSGITSVSRELFRGFLHISLPWPSNASDSLDRLDRLYTDGQISTDQPCLSEDLLGRNQLSVEEASLMSLQIQSLLICIVFFHSPPETSTNLEA